MKKDKKYYTELIEELGKKIVKEKNMIGTYFEGKLKKEYGSEKWHLEIVNDENGNSFFFCLIMHTIDNTNKIW